MRKIIYLLAETRRRQLERHKASLAERNQPTELVDRKIGEVGDMFKLLDSSLSNATPTSTNSVVSEVMTSADFTYAIQEFVQREALPGYQQMQFGFEPLVRPDTVVNFLPHTRYQRRAGLDDLEWVGEKDRPLAGNYDDATKRQISVYRWEKEFDFSMEAIVNDDLGYFSETAMLMGQAARRTLEKYVSRFYTNATTLARLVALGALYSQTGRLTSQRISEARMAFGQRTDARGEAILAEPVYLVYHRGLEDQVRTIQASQLVPENASNAANVVRASFTPIKDPHMAGTAPNLPWFMFTSWQMNNVIPFVLGRLQGWQGPRILRKKSDVEAVTDMLGGGTPVDVWLGDFETGNIVLKVIDIFGTYVDGTEGNMFDNRGCYYSSGTVA